MYDLTAVGECLIDFAPEGVNPQGMALFSRNPGGAPANALAMNARLGGRTAFLGKVGRDAFGDFLQKSLEKAGIDCTGLCRDEKIPTTLAFVQLDEKGDRTFSFYRDPGADLMLRPEDLRTDLLENCRIFHYGSVSLTGEPGREATWAAVRTAGQAGALLSCDPNYRPLLWKDEETALREMKKAVSLADIVKVSREEMTLLTGETDLKAGAERLKQTGPLTVVVTCDAEGAFFDAPAGRGMVPGFSVKAVDSTGAGDAFWGALLSRIPGRGRNTLEAMTLADWKEAVRFANGAGALTVTKKGAIPAMPDRETLEEFLRRQA